MLFLDNSVAPANKIKVYAPIESEHKLHQKGLYILLIVRMELDSPVHKRAVLTSTSC